MLSLECQKYFVHMQYVLKQIRELADNALRNGVIDDELVHEIVELAKSLERAKQAESECYARRLMKDA